MTAAFTFPACWRLTRNEHAILHRLVISRGPVPESEIRAITAPTARTRGGYGTKPRIFIHHLRRKLRQLGVPIENTRECGWWLTATSKAVLMAAAKSEQVPGVGAPAKSGETILSGG